VEVQLSQASLAQDRAGPRQRGRLPRDRIEQLEDVNTKVQAENSRLERAMEELGRKLAASREEFSRNLGITQRELQSSQEQAAKALQDQVDDLVKADAATLQELDVVRQDLARVEAADNSGRQELLDLLETLGRRVESQFEEVNIEIKQLKEVDANLQEQITSNLEESRGVLHKHGEELQRLERVKVDAELWRKTEEEAEERITAEFADVRATLAETEAQLKAALEEAQAALQQEIHNVNEDLQQNCKRIDEELAKLNSDLEAAVEAAKQQLEATRAELERQTEEKVSALSESTDQRFESTRQDIVAKDKAINARVDELNVRTETTFVELNERLEEMIRVERARLATIERDLAEITTKMRSDFRAENERLRMDYEQEAARLDTDLGDLHMKHDVIKQEINFFQSRLLEQKDWTQRQLTETATATRAVQVDAQEGLAAVTKMLHALRDDAVGFREKMGKYIGILQHTSDSHSDAITSLETQRGRIRAELDALIGDHKAYTGDMDGWADDVRVKVERLFRALEPPRMEWRIARAPQRAKELKRPLAMKSPGFSLRGLREVQMEFYPDGHNNAPEGQAVLRIFMPPNANVRFQCWVGRLTEGAREYRSGGNLNAGSLTVDLFLERWKDQIQEDGSVLVVMEVLRDLNNDDESLSREVRIESL